MDVQPSVRLTIPTVEDMHQLGRELARLARGGDLLILDGELGAGKTQLAQGIGEGLGVAGPVISPTFVLARVHPGPGAGVGLVHVDAYRLTSALQVDDLDLEATMPDAVTVVEWGKPLAEHLSPNRLDISIQVVDPVQSDTRLVVVTAVGPRWAGLVGDWEALVNQDLGNPTPRAGPDD
jgi:tRNA threonylcarbamoyladenosine biosynthesis protein TsaE